MDKVASMFNGGSVMIDGHRLDVQGLPWNDHAAFKGVSLKHLVTGKDTGGKFSSHIVRVMDGCEIGEHIHAGKYELHEVIEGRGVCILEGRNMDYEPGVVAVIPEDKKHRVIARDGDLYLLAKFVPALL